MHNNHDQNDNTIRPGVPRERIDASETFYTSPPAAAPDADHAKLESTAPTPPSGVMEAFEYGEWWEPSLTQVPPQAPQMYSPGIGMPGPYPAKIEEGRKDDEINSRRRGPVGFVRALCLVVVCAIVSIICAYGVLELRVRNGDFNASPQVILGAGPAENRPQPQAVVAAPGTMLAEDIYDMACRQVVSIRTTMTSPGTAQRPSRNELFPDEFIIPRLATGSGFIVSTDGYILTNFHVIEEGRNQGWQISVQLFDGRSYPAAIVGYDRDSDIAVIKIDADGLEPVTIGNSDYIRVGQRVYAVGNPFGNLIYTMSEGIISARDRVITVEGKTITTFQLTAAVNPGNSGGPVYNTSGEVIGVVTAKFMSSTVEGIGFAIPINDAISIARSLIAHGFIEGRPLMGIRGQSVRYVHAVYFELVEGFEIHTVNEGSAAEAAGIQVGDIITYLDGDRVRSFEQLTLAMRRFNAGDTTTITVWRDGRDYTLNITFDENLDAGRPSS